MKKYVNPNISTQIPGGWGADNFRLPSSVTKLTAHFTCGLMSDLQTQNRVWWYVTVNVPTRTWSHQTTLNHKLFLITSTAITTLLSNPLYSKRWSSYCIAYVVAVVVAAAVWALKVFDDVSRPPKTNYYSFSYISDTTQSFNYHSLKCALFIIIKSDGIKMIKLYRSLIYIFKQFISLKRKLYYTRL